MPRLINSDSAAAAAAAAAAADGIHTGLLSLAYGNSPAGTDISTSYPCAPPTSPNPGSPAALSSSTPCSSPCPRAAALDGSAQVLLAFLSAFFSATGAVMAVLAVLVVAWCAAGPRRPCPCPLLPSHPSPCLPAALSQLNRMCI
jgi:hypothetical protein